MTDDSRNKEKVAARAYVKFKTAEKVVAMGQGFGGKLIADSKGISIASVPRTLLIKPGNQSIPSVEFSPFQRTPKKHRKPDSRQGTIDKDQDYLAFLESLKTSTEATTAESNLNSDKFEKPSSTPLIDYLRAQKAAPASSSGASDKASVSSKASRLKDRARGKRGGKGKERERVPPAPPVPVVPKLAKRETSTLQEGTNLPVKPAPAPKRVRPAAAVAAAIVQRDLALGAQRRRKEKQAATGEDSVPHTPISTTAGGSAVASPTTTTAPGTPTDTGDAGRRNRRKDRFRGERSGPRRAETAPALEQSTVEAAVSTGKQLPSLPSLAPMAILRKQSTSGAAGLSASAAPPQVLRRESTAPPSIPAAGGAIPTGPKGGRPERGGRRGGRGGRDGPRDGGNASANAPNAAPSAAPAAASGDSAAPAPPTGPQGDGGRGGGRGGRGGRGRGGLRGGRGRGGPPAAPRGG